MPSRYAQWMYDWETRLTSVDNNRVVRPLEWGVEWARDWPCRNGFAPGSCARDERSGKIPARVQPAHRRSSDEFYSYTTPTDFRLERREVQVFSTREVPDPKLEAKVRGTHADFLRFTSPVHTPYPENNLVNARWFPARGRRAVVLLPHWNSDALAYTGLCRVLNLLGIAVLRLSMPYHDIRMPADTRRADYAVSANIGRTLDACRQAVVDVRCCLDWLEQQGYSRAGHPGHQPGFVLRVSCGGARSAHSGGRFQSCLHQCRGRGLARAIHAPHPAGTRSADRSRAAARLVERHQPDFVLRAVRPLAEEVAHHLCEVRYDFSAWVFARCGGGV